MIGDHHHLMMSVKLEIKVSTSDRLWRRPLRSCRAHCAVTRPTGKSGWALSRLPDGTIAAESEMTLADVPKDVLGEGLDMEALGWYIDPES